jgi:hypothetical protein
MVQSIRAAKSFCIALRQRQIVAWLVVCHLPSTPSTSSCVSLQIGRVSAWTNQRCLCGV